MHGKTVKYVKMFFQTSLQYTSQRHGSTFVIDLADSEVLINGGGACKASENLLFIVLRLSRESKFLFNTIVFITCLERIIQSLLFS